MRQLIVEVPRGRGHEVLDVARKHRGSNLAWLEARGADDCPLDVALVHVSNAQVQPLLDELQTFDQLHVTLAPEGVLALRPPPGEAPEQVTSVEARSPVEVFLSGLQSVGSWRGFLGYAAVGGAVVWIGLFTNTVYLLVAAMLIAPYAGPAMNAAIATARGDGRLLARSLLRYFVGLAVTILIAALLSLALRQEIATPQMIQSSKVSSTAALLPLVAGVAGALNLCQSQRTSLVSGAATGVLVAASLAPPAGLIGMAAVLGDWELVTSGAFVVLLQIVGINLSGAIVFRTFGLSARGPRYTRGRAWVFPAVVGATSALLIALLIWQFWSPPGMQRSTREQRTVAAIQEAVDESGLARLVEANARFTRADTPGQSSLLVVVYVERASSRNPSDQEIRERLAHSIRARIRYKGLHVAPLVAVTVVEGDRPA